MQASSSRRRFFKAAVAAGVAPLTAQSPGHIRGFDHVALPMQNTEAMLAFYRALGLPVTETPNACSVYIGDQMINFHRPALWQRETFTLRAPAARPPCGGPVLCVGGRARVAESHARPRRGQGHRRPGGPAGRPEEVRLQRLRPRSGRQPPVVHDLLVRLAGNDGRRSVQVIQAPSPLLWSDPGGWGHWCLGRLSVRADGDNPGPTEIRA
jgi:catechol 2,3-dioxygenase-like lactoylglutathione lyase family enzyme